MIRNPNYAIRVGIWSNTVLNVIKSCVHSRRRSRFRCASERFVVALRARLVSPTARAFAVDGCRAGEDDEFFSGWWPGVRKLPYAGARAGSVRPFPVRDEKSPGPAPGPAPRLCPKPFPELQFPDTVRLMEALLSAVSEDPSFMQLVVFCRCCCSLSFMCITARFMIAKR